MVQPPYGLLIPKIFATWKEVSSAQIARNETTDKPRRTQIHVYLYYF